MQQYATTLHYYKIFMASDNRDWHRSWWARKEGYVEKTDFRLPASVVTRKRKAQAFKKRIAKPLLFIVVFVLVVVLMMPKH